MNGLVLFFIAIGLAVMFEIAYAFFDRFCRIPLDKPIWCIFLWGAVYLLCMTEYTRPPPNQIPPWFPAMFVALAHIFINLADGRVMHLWRKSRDDPDKNPSSFTNRVRNTKDEDKEDQ